MGKPGPVLWFEKEEEYLQYLYQLSQYLSERYMDLYKVTHSKQTKLRLPAIILSSFSGVASFGNTSFPLEYQRYVSISVGLINITIAMLQTYESYLKIADIVAKALTVSIGLKKLADDIYCELYIPIEDRETNGITFLRDAFSRYGAIVYQAPPLEDTSIDGEKADEIANKIKNEIKKRDKNGRIDHGNDGIISESNTPRYANLISVSNNGGGGAGTGVSGAHGHGHGTNLNMNASMAANMQMGMPMGNMGASMGIGNLPNFNEKQSLQKSGSVAIRIP